MVFGSIDVSTGSGVGGSILLPDGLQVEFSGIGKNDGGVDSLVGLFLGLSLYLSSVEFGRGGMKLGERQGKGRSLKVKGREGDIRLSQPWRHRSFGVAQWKTSFDQLLIVDKFGKYIHYWGLIFVL